MGSPIIPQRKVNKLFKHLQLYLEKSNKDWIVYYKGKPIAMLAIKHGDAEKGIFKHYVVDAIKAKLKSDGLEPGLRNLMKGTLD